MFTRSSRSRLARLFALLLAFSLFAAACGDDGGTDATDTDADADDDGDTTGDDDGEAPGTSAPEEGEGEDEQREENPGVVGGTLTVSVEAPSDGLNPTSNNFATSAYIMGYQIYDPMFYVDTEGNWFPWLAESAEPVGDGSSWLIKVREGVTFHDGTPFNAAAVAAAFDATLNDPLISLAVVPSYPETDRYELIDEYTIQFNLIRPSQHFPVNLTSQLGFIPSPDYLVAAAENPELDQMPIGTGPFKVEEREPGVRTLLVRNDDYWQGTDDIYLDAIEVLPITDTVIAAERVARGEIDLIVTSNPEAQLTLEASPGIETASNVLGAEDDIMMNTSRPPFDDIRVRQALTYATDRQGYFDIIAQGTKPLADSMFHPDTKWHNPDIVQEGNTPELAAPLIVEYCAENPVNEAGDPMCTNGKVNMELQYSGPSVTQTLIMDLFINGWEDYFNVTRQELLQTDHITEVAFGLYDVVTWRQFGAIEPDNEVVWLECATAGAGIALNWVRVCDEDRDTHLFAQRATLDEDERIAAWQEIAQNVHDSYAYVFLTHSRWVLGYSENVKNLCGTTGPDGDSVTCNADGSIFLHNAWIE
ncbi:MAG: ABC transporter substrate-binding protein [Acidimicrobiales bacterium]